MVGNGCECLWKRQEVELTDSREIQQLMAFLEMKWSSIFLPVDLKVTKLHLIYTKYWWKRLE